jgi:MarR family transcriptional regulator, lower aerobic nicotinate degradation pathway regulator
MAADGRDGLDLGFLSDLLGYRIRLAQIAAYKDFEAVTKGFGQAPRYFGLLCLIEANPGLPQGRLAEAVHLVRSSLVPIIDKLEAEGVVERRSALGDRRLKAVWMTAKGKKLMTRLRPLVAAHESRLTQGISAADKGLMLRLLQRAVTNLRQEEQAAGAA